MAYEEIKDKDALLEKYAGDFETLERLLGGLPPAAIDFVPALPDAWSIREHVAHLADTEVNGFVRFRRAVLNPGTTIDLGAGDMEKSAGILGYASQDPTDSLALILTVRKVIAAHAARIKKADFDKYYIEHLNHPLFKRCTIGFTLSVVVQHFDKHLEYMRRNVDLFGKAHGR